MKSDTLIIKHFPREFSRKDKEDFLTSCGAIEVNAFESKYNKFNTTFARFTNSESAEKALQQLHQQELMGAQLAVEYSKPNTPRCSTNLSNDTKREIVDEGGSEILLKKVLEKLNSWCNGSDFRVPIPKHLSYAYPPPDSSTLRNICRLLATVPRLYTQVLHLANKMNLPCPIGPDLPGLGALPSNFQMTGPAPFEPIPLMETLPQQLSSSDPESELSGAEDSALQKETIPIIHRSKKRKMKRTLLTKPPLPAYTPKAKKIAIEAVFDDPRTLTEEPLVKKSKLTPLPSKISPSPAECKVAQKEDIVSEGFGFIHPVNKHRAEEAEHPSVLRDEREEERGPPAEKIPAISSDALSANRISEKDRSVLPVFKNYAEGAPSCRLYVKNLAKQTTEEELSFIYSRFRRIIKDEPDMFDIKLMQQGRMKGQAFITLQSTDLARKAVNETNGYILNDKPMVVLFARSAVKQ